jgi:hypothetical protein
MKKLTFFISVCLISMMVVAVADSNVFSQIVLAKDAAKKSDASNPFSLHSYDSIGNPEQPYADSSILLPFSSGIAGDISSSFSNIIDTQIFAGLDD